MTARLTPADVQEAQRQIAPRVRRTPLHRSEALGELAGGQAFLKLECWQQTGSFKVRGALHRLATLRAEAAVQSVVTASAGNHGLGVVYACDVLGLGPATVFVPENASPVKVRRLARLGCTLRIAGPDYDACHLLAERYAADCGGTYVSAYDDPVVIAGQGTVGLEILEDLPNAEVLVVPVGGGGLIAGVATVAKAWNPRIRVVGVQPEASPAAYLSLRDGRPYETYPAAATLCDGLAGGFGAVPFALARSLIDDILVVSEAQVRRAVAWLAAEEQLLVEGSAAIAIAPLLSATSQFAGRKAVAVLTGRNLDVAVLRDILTQETK